MHRRRCLWFLTLLLVLTSARSASAAPPWQALFGFRKIEADPNKLYYLTEQQGPWVILCTSFAGEGGEQQAHALVLELRSKFRLNAYMHKREYDFTKTVAGKGIDKYGQPKRMRYNNATRYAEIAVLVGDFESVEDPTLQKTLEKIKYMQPESLQLVNGQRTSQRYALLREVQRRINPDPDKKSFGPMGNSFATRNPLIPEEFFAPKGLDPLVLRMNEDVEHSLLNCRGKYSVRVASFRGRVELDQRKIKEFQNSPKYESRLARAAEDAHRLTELLRSQRIEAYEFHDLHESVVTVGSFQSVGTPRPDGKTEINPAVHAVMETYGARREQLPNGLGLSGIKPRSIGGIPLDIQAAPILVPRKSIGADYARGSFQR